MKKEVFDLVFTCDVFLQKYLVYFEGKAEKQWNSKSWLLHRGQEPSIITQARASLPKPSPTEPEQGKQGALDSARNTEHQTSNKAGPRSRCEGSP